MFARKVQSLAAGHQHLHARADGDQIADVLGILEDADAGSFAGKAADWVIAIGEHAGRIVQAAKKAGLSADHAIVADSADRAVEAVRPLLSPKTQVLVKGSRGMRMERIVEAIRAPS